MILKIIKRITIFPLALILTIFFFIFILIFLTLLIIPIFIHRHLVILLAKCIFPGSKILPGLDNLMAKGNVYLQSDMYLALQLNLEGTIDYNFFIEQWQTKIMKKVLPDGKLHFPELQSYISTLIGYSFYRPEKSFQLQDHIKLYQDPVPNSFVNRKRLDKIRADFVKILFKKGRSPWEILIVNNYKNDDEDDGKEYSVVIFKYHHCLADGYATLLLFWETLGGLPLEALNQPKSASLKTSFRKKLIGIMSAVYHYVLTDGKRIFYFFYDWSILYDKNSWHDNKHTANMVTCALRPINTKMVKEISQDQNISVTATILTICVGGFRRMMTAKGRTAPKTIRTAFSLPLPGHPKRLTTHSFVSDFNIPVALADDTKRLKQTDRNLSNSVRASLLISASLAKLLLFNLPLAWNVKVKTPSADSLFFSSVRLPSLPTDTKLEFNRGCRTIGTYISCDLSGIQNHSIAILILKYKDDFFVNFGIQKYLLENDDEIYDIEKYILKELYHIKNLTTV